MVASYKHKSSAIMDAFWYKASITKLRPSVDQNLKALWLVTGLLHCCCLSLKFPLYLNRIVIHRETLNSSNGLHGMRNIMYRSVAVVYGVVGCTRVVLSLLFGALLYWGVLHYVVMCYTLLCCAELSRAVVWEQRPPIIHPHIFQLTMTKPGREG